MVLWRSSDALTVPLTALFRSSDGWAVFRMEDDRAALQKIELGQRNGLVAQVVSGLTPGDQVVLHPSDRVMQNVRIEAR